LPLKWCTRNEQSIEVLNTAATLSDLHQKFAKVAVNAV